ncbi:hypothetical protein M3P21_09390 [Ruegeria sp. 2012CJ41-6]|uniref:Uncharacterized protein n=1 Tax=Ruegeria spongiae TaxID=2942209 RepID=A0ABT0Q1M5_9RHOB|nr:hypothetical protein [Ruegeria spongiae]MCL6283740.1 hypothetical protein [Ruegeria spongiae]
MARVIAAILSLNVFGAAVNVAVRLQAASPPGGCLISRVAQQIADGLLGVALKPEGTMTLKGLPVPIDVLSLDLQGGNDQAERTRQAARQNIRFTSSRDGTGIAWTETGQGRTLVKAPNWVQHLEYEWTDNPMDGWLHYKDQYQRLAAGIPGTRFVGLDTANNTMPDYDPEWPKALREISIFLDGVADPGQAS